MKSRAQILEAIKAAKPAPRPLPEIPAFPPNGISASQAFASVSATSGSRVVRASEFEDLTTAVRTIYDNPATIVSPMEEIESDIDLHNTQPEGLEKVDVAVLAGQIGVAENGAVWVSEQESVHRVLPFIAQHLVLVLPEANIVRNMHEAYQQIRIDATGFGVFIAGPSKTADIEQSLVIGAQGARSLTIILT